MAERILAADVEAHPGERLRSVRPLGGGCIGEVYRAKLEDGSSLVRLHGITADAYGHERDTLIGSLTQPNPWNESWAEFFGEHRLLYAAGDVRRVEKLAGRLDEFVGEPNPPALIYGDAWSANVLAKGDGITAFLDPAIYHADPEIELSYILFDSLGESFMQRYAELRTVREGFFEARHDLYGQYPLLVHAYYFGGVYPGSVRGVLGRFGV